MIEINSVTKKYGNTYALNDLTVVLPAKKTHVLLGSSGSGKSTLLRTILGLIALDSGTIQVNGNLISELSPTEKTRQLGYVPQDAGLFPHLTAQQNIVLVAKSLGWTKSQITARLTELNQIVMLEEPLMRRFPSELSGGQKQRVAFLRALFLNPDVILMDEPFGALDPLVRADIQVEAKDLFKRLEKTVVFVTHDVGEASFLADSIALMHQGRLIQQGMLHDLVEQPADPFVSKFLQAQRVMNISKDAN